MQPESAPREAPIEILLVEDNPADVRLTMEAFKEACVPARWSFATNGDEALGFLRRRSAGAGLPTPGLVLLDLNMPGTDGRRVLAEVKTDPALKDIPVLVLTTSSAERDKTCAAELGADSYFIKPMALDAFVDLIRVIDQTWIRLRKESRPACR